MRFNFRIGLIGAGGVLILFGVISLITLFASWGEAAAHTDAVYLRISFLMIVVAFILFGVLGDSMK